MRVVVTGADGFLGWHTRVRLRALTDHEVVPVGVAGGEITLSLAALIFRINAVRASNTGTLQDLRDVIALANAGKLKPTPVTERPINEANEALQDLKHGRVTGRQILVHSCANH